MRLFERRLWEGRVHDQAQQIAKLQHEVECLKQKERGAWACAAKWLQTLAGAHKGARKWRRRYERLAGGRDTEKGEAGK